MPKPLKPSDDLMLPTSTPLAEAEARKYVEHQKSANLNSKVAEYMFWGATSIIGALAVGLMTTGVGPLLLAGGVAASVGTFFGSMFFSQKATEITEKSNVLYSDIDSQNQAHRMVQTFARAQSQGTAPAVIETPFTTESAQVGATAEKTSWVARTSSAPTATMSSWQSKVVEQADREDAQTLARLG